MMTILEMGVLRTQRRGLPGTEIQTMGEQGAEANGNWVWQEVPQSWELAGHRVTSEGGGLGDSDPRGVRQWCPKGENFLGGALPGGPFPSLSPGDLGSG